MTLDTLAIIYTIIIPQFIGLIISVSLIIYLTRTTKNVLVNNFVYLILVVISWLTFNILELESRTPELITIFGILSYASIALVVVTSFLFVTKFINNKTLTKYRWAFILVPLVSLPFILTSQSTQLVFTTRIIQLNNEYSFTRFIEGPLFWFFAWFNYGALILAALLLMSKTFSSNYLYKRQAAVLLIGLLFPVSLDFIDSVNPDIFIYSPTSLAFIVTELLFLISLRRYNFLDVLPLVKSFVFNKIDEAVFIINNSDVILDLNEQASELVRNGLYDKKEIIGLSTKDVFAKYFDLTTQSSEFTLGDRSYNAGIKDMTIKDNKIGRIITIKDVTALRKAEELEKKHEIDELRNEFMTRISHELRQPLTPIIGFSQELKSMIKTGKGKDYINRVLDNATYLKGLVEKAITLTRMSEENKLALSRENMQGVLDEVIKEFESKARIIKDYASNPLVVIDHDKMRIALVNVLDNAVRYGKGEIKVKISNDSEYGIITIQDNGQGIKQDVLNKLNKGEYLATIDAAVLRKGLGVGLKIVNQVIELNNGKLEIINVKPHGTRITIKIPLSKK